MKKTYINPVMGIVKVQTQQMLAVSGVLSTEETITKSSDFGARDMDFDDDED